MKRNKRKKKKFVNKKKQNTEPLRDKIVDKKKLSKLFRLHYGEDYICGGWNLSKI